MTNPLTSLDELIWKQFEKVTQYAQKNYGCDKWDLATITTKGMGYSFCAGGVYYALGEYSTGSYLLGTMGGLITLGMSYCFNSIMEMYAKISRREELDQITRKRAVQKPSFGMFRPIMLMASTVPYVLGSSLVLRYDLVQDRHLNDDAYRTAAELAFFALGTMALSFTGFTYFESQLPTPPSTKKHFWKTIYEGIKNKFKPKPQLEPVVEPAPQHNAEYFI